MNNFSNLDEKGPPMQPFGGPFSGSPSGFGSRPANAPPMGASIPKPPMGTPPPSPFGAPPNMPTGGGSGGFPGRPPTSPGTGSGFPKPPSAMGMPQSGLPGNTQGSMGSMGSTVQQPEPKPFIPLNKELQTSREQAVKKFTSTLFSTYELLPLLVGTVDLVTFTRTLTILSAVLFVIHFVWGTLLDYTTLLSPLQVFIPVALNALWYLYAKNVAPSSGDMIEDAVDALPDIVEGDLSKKLNDKELMNDIQIDSNTDDKPTVQIQSTNSEEVTKSCKDTSSFKDSFEGFSGFQPFDSSLSDTMMEASKGVPAKEPYSDSLDTEFASYGMPTDSNFSSFDCTTPVSEEIEAVPEDISTGIEESVEDIPTDGLFEDPTDLDINLDDYIPKAVDLSVAKEVSLSDILQQTELSSNMKTIETMGNEISNLIDMLGNI